MASYFRNAISKLWNIVRASIDLLRDRLQSVEFDSEGFKNVPYDLKTQDMCNNAVKNNVWLFEYVPDQFQNSRDV